MYNSTKEQINWTPTKWYERAHDEQERCLCPDCVCTWVEDNLDYDHNGERYVQCGGQVYEMYGWDQVCSVCGRTPKPIEIPRIWNE